MNTRDLLDAEKIVDAWAQVDGHKWYHPSANDTRPAWTRGRTVWVEDDSACYDRERISAAWLRMFETSCPDTCLALWDGGDTFARLHENGYVSWSSYCGGKITIAGLAPITGNVEYDQWNAGRL